MSTHSQSVLNHGFDDYALPSPHSAFSEYYFSILTFVQTEDLSYPTIAPPGSLVSQRFLDIIPRSAAGTIITPYEVIPNILDLLETTSGIEDAFKNGMRSAEVHFIVNGAEYLHIYHFSKIRLITLVNNHKNDIIDSCCLLDHLSSNLFDLGLALETFRNSPISTRIKGVYAAKFPLSHLGCLLSEDWLHEDVFNALSELAYFRNYVGTARNILSTTSLILPTSFITDLRVLYARTPRIYSAEILELRQRLQFTPIKHIGMGCIDNNHFTAYVYESGSSYLRHGDSLHQPAAVDLLQIFNWAFLGVLEPPVSSFQSGRIALQGGTNGGQGSCAIAALNFIEISIDKSLAQWSGHQSQLFRNSALEDLIQYHHYASNAPGSFHDWVQRESITPPDSFSRLDHGELNWGYNDFNLYGPLSIHPIHMLILHKTSLQDSIRPTSQRLPLLGGLSSTVVSLPLQLSSNSTVMGRKRKIEPVSESDTCLSPKPTYGKQKRPRHVSVISISSSDSESDMVKQSPDNGRPYTPVPKCEPQWIGSIDLCSPDERKPIFLVSSCSPNEKKPVLESIKKEPSGKEIIDLCTPEKTNVQRLIEPSFGVIRVGSIFESWEDAQTAVYRSQEELGFWWRMGQGKQDSNGARKKITLRCSHYQRRTSTTHSKSIDPADYRKGRSITSDCNAHINLNRIQASNSWHITLIDWKHNHTREIPEGAPVRHRPTLKQQAAISRLATNPCQNFSRGQIAAVINAQESEDAPKLEPKQISNIINDARRKARDEVTSLGGDFQAIISSLQKKSQEEHGWCYHLKLDNAGIVTGLWWQSPLQAELTRRYYDILINDATYNRNRNGYPLNIGIVIDGFGCSRNIWYALHSTEDILHHTWVFKCHLESAGQAPDTLMTDRHQTLIAVAKIVMPLTNHYFCIHHLDGNVSQRLRVTLGSDWNEFKHMFWMAYRAVSPEEFDRLWNIIINRFPTAQRYLNEELYPCRKQWAWAFTSFQFTCGVRTNGRCEGENRVNKAIGGPKKSVKQLFDGLNERTDGQGVQDMIRVRDLSRRQHAGPIESIIPEPLALLRNHVGPYAFQTCFKQMELSMFYQTEVLHRPEGVRDWNEYAIQVGNEIGFDWIDSEEDRMINRFENDKSYISTKYLLRLVSSRGLKVVHLLRITHRGHSAATHILAILPNNNYICDCCMGLNLGIPCRHYFQALNSVKNLQFDLGVIRARWYQDNKLDLSTITSTSPAHENQPAPPGIKLLTVEPILIASAVTANPLRRSHAIPAICDALNPTETIPARTVFHEAQTALRPLTSGIQTREQLEDLLQSLENLHSTQREVVLREQIRDPPIINPKGRPRTQRMTGGIEGRPRGGGANIRSQRPNIGHEDGRKCSICRQPGHNRKSCPELRC